MDFILSFDSKYEPLCCRFKVETSHEIRQPQGAEIPHRFGVSKEYSNFLFFLTHRPCFRSPLSFLLHLIDVLLRDYVLIHK